jgi:hypothetical protein
LGALPTATPTPRPAAVKFKVISVYPNPIPPTGAKIVVSLPWPARLHCQIYDVRGELIWEGSQDYPLAGNYEMPWAAQNSSGASASYGAYYLLAKADYSAGTASDGRWISVVR